jgi:hypothetical protein
MNRLLIVGTLLISTVPLFAQGQRPDMAKLKTDAEKVVSIISGDKAKRQTYCHILDLGDELDQLDEQKDRKRAGDRSQKISDLEKTLGPEYLALADSLQNMDPISRDSQEIVSIIEGLDKSCED